MKFLKDFWPKWEAEREQIVLEMMKRDPQFFEPKPLTRLEKFFLWFLALGAVAGVIAVVVSH